MGDELLDVLLVEGGDVGEGGVGVVVGDVGVHLGLGGGAGGVEIQGKGRGGRGLRLGHGLEG